MSTIPTFADALASNHVDANRIETDEFEETLSRVVTKPAVGAPFPFDGVSCVHTPVTESPSPLELTATQTGVTAARFGIADYGSLVVESGTEATERVSLYPSHHVAVLQASDVLSDMESAFERLADRSEAGATSAVLATGPSSTADMGELVYGAHGPESVMVVLLEDR